jgi:tetratricopeptide (TPR) repeat protein
MQIRIAIYLSFVFFLQGCESIAILTTPKKEAAYSTNRLANQAESLFWETLHSGNYHDIPESERLLTAAYIENPNDPRISSHLGFLHIWKITERNRIRPVPPTIINEIILSKYYFADAFQLNPGDARIHGFLGDTQLISGKISHDEREQTHGYFTLKKAIRAWPEFNYFTAGYPMSDLSPQSWQFKEGLAWQWETLNLCAGKKVNRKNPTFAPYLYRNTQIGSQRACWNSWIAPYNFQGFFLNMGDMLVKSGDWQTAIKIYKNAKLEKSYSKWPYKNLLETRIKNAKNNVRNFQQSYTTPDKTILFNSGYGCVACHQKS